MEANAEIKQYVETIERLLKLLKIVCQERDEARNQLQLLLRNFQTSMESTQKPGLSTKTFSNCCSYEKPFSMGDSTDSGSVLIDKLVLGKPLPQKGRLLRTVTEAGPLLHTLFVAPLPKWQNNPPPLSSFSFPPNRTYGHGNDSCSASVHDKASVNPKAKGVVPTCLNLALPVKNEPMPSCVDNMDADIIMMKNCVLTRKKRKLV